VNRHAIKPLISKEAEAALQGGRHSLDIADVILLLKLELIKPVGRTADGRVTCYSLTGSGRIMAANARARS
jgi:hypothetical protein